MKKLAFHNMLAFLAWRAHRIQELHHQIVVLLVAGISASVLNAPLAASISQSLSPGHTLTQPLKTVTREFRRFEC